MYLPVFCGAALRKPEEIPAGYQRDDEGENISVKNPNYCELTALYWAWKNLPPEVEAVGLCHYRRHFTTKGVLGYKLSGKWNSILTKEQAEKLLEKADVILPNKRRYWIETNYNHYIHAHKREGLELAGKYVKGLSIEYTDAWDKVLHKRTWAYMFNMMVMKRVVFDSYCEWIFDVLGEIEEKLDLSNYNPVESRVFGYIGELLLSIRLEIIKNDLFECHAIFMENQRWIVKVKDFFSRKLHSGVKQ
jgi:hypothetical protein